MNLTSNYLHVPVSPANPATQTVRQENLQREVIKPTHQVEPFPREPGVAKEHETQRNQSKESRQRFSPTDSSPLLSESTPTRSEELVEAITEQHSGGEQGSGSDAQEQASNSDENEAKAADIDSDSSGDERDRTGEEREEQSLAEHAELAELKALEQEVFAHEQAHAAVGGAHTGTPKYNYERGPDGVRYATSGEVSVDLSPVEGDPEATINKMRQIRSAALAPADPSSQDLKIAAKANQIIARAQQELLTGEKPAPVAASVTNSFTEIDITDAASSRSHVDAMSEGLYTESLMYSRNQVIAQTYRKSSWVTVSAYQTSA